MNSSSSQVAYCAVDCTTTQALCKEFEIPGYPTIKYFSFGKFVSDYENERTVNSLRLSTRKEARKSVLFRKKRLLNLRKILKSTRKKTSQHLHRPIQLNSGKNLHLVMNIFACSQRIISIRRLLQLVKHQLCSTHLGVDIVELPNLRLHRLQHNQLRNIM